MMRSIFLKTLYDRRWFIFGWTLGMLALAALMASFFPAMRMEGGMDALLANMPAAFQGLVGNLGDLNSFDTYIASQLFDIRVPIIAGVMAIILGLGLSTKDEDSGELRTILALPISRTSLLLQKWLAMVVIMIIATVGLITGVYLTLPFLDDAALNLAPALRLGVMTLLVMVTFGTLTYAVGMMSGKKAIANPVATLVIIGSFLLTTFSSAVDWLNDYEWMSILHYFPAVDIVQHGIALKDVAVLLLFCILLLVVSVVLFRKRDIG